MKIFFPSCFGGGMVFVALFALSCGGSTTGSALSAEQLLSQGRFEEAKLAAISRGNEPMDRAVVALSILAQEPSTTSAEAAVAVLDDDSSSIGKAVAATEMLALVFTLPSVPQVLSLTSAEVALGAIGHGSLARSTASLVHGSEASTTLATSALERLFLWTRTPDVTIDPGRLLDVWNGSYTLLGGSLKATDDLSAWRLFTSIGGLAVVMENVAPSSDLTRVLLGSAVSVIEQNPDIAVPARCDLSSPFDDLRRAAARDRKLLGRLERAVAVATGCTLGQYAPKKEE